MDPAQTQNETVYGRRFAELLDGLCPLPRRSLSNLNEETTRYRSSFRSGLVERVEQAWVTPLTEITCDQVRVLVSQKFGLEWLSEPVAVFVTHFPRVECDVFPGDMTLNALRASTEFLQHAPAASLDMLAADYSWLAQDFADDSLKLWSEAAKELALGRKLARIQ